MALSLDNLKVSYLWWFKNAYSYYWMDGFPMEGCELMSDNMWSGLGGLYYENIEYFPFLSRLEFTGPSLGAHCTKEVLWEEIENEKRIRIATTQ